MTDSDHGTGSPQWGSTTKLLVGLTFVAIVAALLIRFRSIIGPILLAFILAYVLHPVANRVCKTTRLSWRTSVNGVYLLLVILVGGAFTLTGLALIQQLQSLVSILQTFVADLPELADELSTQVYFIGPFEVALSQIFDLERITEQLLSALQPLLGQVGTVVRTLAGGAFGVFGWGAFTLLVSYFVLADSGRWFPEMLVSIEIPGHSADMSRLGRELARIWNAFLRGQLILFVLTGLTSFVVLTALGLRFTLGLALLAGLARFIPYVGPASLWVVTFLVAVFQESNYIGLGPLQYALVAVVAQLLIDQAYDMFLTPRFLGQTLGVHPAAVLVAAIIATNLIGLVGLLLAAPVLATIQLIGTYAVRKMFELEPWPSGEFMPEPAGITLSEFFENSLNSLRRFRSGTFRDFVSKLRGSSKEGVDDGS